MTDIGTLSLHELQSVLDARGKAYDLLLECGADPGLSSRLAAELSDAGRWLLRQANHPELRMYADLYEGAWQIVFKFAAADPLPESAWDDAPPTALCARRESARGASSAGEVFSICVRLERRAADASHEKQLQFRLHEIVGRKSREELLKTLRLSNEALVSATDKANKEAHAAHQQLFHLQKIEAIGQLTGGLAHDFNNLLAIIIGNLDLLAESVPGNAISSRRLDTAIAAAQRGASLTRSLLAVARNQNLAPELIDLRAHLCDLLPLVRTSLGGGISLVDKLGEMPLVVCVDAGGLDSAILNLAANARDAMKGKGKVIIECAIEYAVIKGQSAGDDTESGYARISVFDDGPGMSVNVRERAFDPFFTTKERGRGTGLGLSMVHGFCRQSGGDARIASEPGRGTRINLLLPLVSTANLQGGGTSLNQDLEPGSGSILVVDDEPELLEITSTLLRNMGYSVRECHTGSEALRLLQDSAYDLLVTDIIMPSMDGFELARQARKYRPGLGLLYLSGFSEPVNRNEANIKAELLQKPYTKDALARMVKRTLAGAARAKSADTASA